MREQISQRVAFAGHVVEDLTYQALEPGDYQADLSASGVSPLYKPGGFFVFLNLPARDYTVNLSGASYQARAIEVTVPVSGTLLRPAGDNELIVAIKTVNSGAKRITFSPVTLAAGIRAGAAVLASGLVTTLSSSLLPGEVSQARFESLGALSPGDIVRIIRDNSVRLKFGPYFIFEAPVTRLVGRVTAQGSEDAAVPGARVRLAAVGGNAVTVQNVAGARVATCDAAGGPAVLGCEQDIVTSANAKGDFHLYFERDLPASGVELAVSAPGFVTLAQSFNVPPKTRVRADLQLTKV